MKTRFYYDRQRAHTMPRTHTRFLAFLGFLMLPIALLAQPGKTCSNPLNLGTLRDTVMTLTLSYPQTDLWLRFTTTQPRPFVGVTGTGAQQVRWQQANVYGGCSQNLTNLPPNPAPGRTGMALKPNLPGNGTYLLHLKRYYTTSGAGTDTSVNTFRLGTAPTLQANCPGGPLTCGNLAENGDMEAFNTNAMISILTDFPFSQLCKWEAGGFLMYPYYFSTALPSNSPYRIPIASYPSLTGNSQNPGLGNAASNGIIGIRTSTTNSDVVRLPISNLGNQLYFVSYDVTAGKNYAVYNNRVDLDVSASATYSMASYPLAGYNPTIQSGEVNNGTPSNQWTTRSAVFQGNPNLQSIFIGNLALQLYSGPQSGVPGQDCKFVFLDNVILKPFTVALPSSGTTVCQGQAVSVNLDCAYAFPGANYTWQRANGNVILTNNNGALANYTATQTETLTLSVSVNGQTVSANYTITVTNTTIGITPSSAIPPGNFCSGNSSGQVPTTLAQFQHLVTFQAPAANSYQWQVNGVPVAGATSSSFTPVQNQFNAGQYTISVVLNGNSLCSPSTQFNLVANPCQLPCIRLLGNTKYTASSNYINGTHNNPNSSTLSNSSIIGEVVVVDGTFRVSSNNTPNNPLTFTNCTIWMTPGAQIEVAQGAGLALTSTTVDGCVQMWNRIVNEGTLTVTNSTLRHAEAAIEVTANSKTRVESTLFHDNVVGIYSRSINTFVTYPITQLTVGGSTFSTNGGFLPSFDITHSQYVYSVSYPIANNNLPMAQPPMSTRPASGIYLSWVANVDLTPPANSGPNRFLNLWNGIGLIDCGTAKIANCIFEGMEHNLAPSTATTINIFHQQQPIGDAAIANGAINQSIYSNSSCRAVSALRTDLVMLPAIGDSPNLPTIRNCYRGIYVLNGSFNDTLSLNAFNNIMMTIRDVQVGITLERIQAAKVCRVFKFRVLAHCNGLEATRCMTDSKVYFYNNDVEFVYLNTVWQAGGNCFKVVQTGNSQIPRVVVRNNTFTVRGDRGFGGELVWANEAWIQNNTISIFDGVNTIPPQPNLGIFRGLFIRLGSHNWINDNVITCSRNNPINGNIASAGIFLSATRNNKIYCNQINRMPVGIRISDFCGGTELGSNFINENGVGLHMYRFDTTASSVKPFIGQQPFMGNTWLSDASSYQVAARYDHYDVNDLSANRFRVGTGNAPPTGRSFIPPSFSAPLLANQWFQTWPGGINQNCSYFHNLLPSDDNIADIPATSAAVVQMVQLAEMAPDNSLFGAESDWLKKKALYINLKENSDLVYADAALTTSFDSLSNTELGQTVDAIYQAEDAYKMDESTAQNIEALSATITSLFNAWQNHAASGDLIQAQADAEAIAQAHNQRLELYAQWSLVVDAKRAAAKSQNMSIMPSVLPEDNYKTVVDVYLAAQTTKGFENLKQYEYDIYSVASQCPVTGGDAVYIARTMYEVLHPEVVFSDSNLCQGVVANRMAQIALGTATSIKSKPSSNAGAAKGWRIAPNPVGDYVQVQGIQQHVVSWVISDALGQTLMQGTQQAGNFVPISVSHLPKGFYSLTMVQETGQRIVLKFVH